MIDSARKIRVALADDHNVFREGVRRLLSLEDDLEVVAMFEDGSEVIDGLDSVDPDVLLLDLRMPGLNGLATLEKLAARKLRTKIVVLTASEDQQQYIAAVNAGASGVMLKQSATEFLADCVRRVKNGEIWLDDRALPLPDGQPSCVVRS